ncbi:electron transfer flavoprotein subunit beta/FixA family protein [Elongatibacter sediminis]|uniref:Electron transfer flavoprotein alpha/beta-subunit N-terminal domain-containing protein n=1 Tax=Elongatibacter sediminis TaxID=3119006 RepID=A0AAW9RKK1_9GAMM
MKIVVCIKQVMVLPGAVVLDGEGTGIDPLFVTRRLNDPDRYAVEEAIRLCEEHGGGEVVVVSVGGAEADKELRKCLAMGAQRAVRVADDGLQLFDPLVVARALALVARREAADLVLCGVQSEDAAQQATGPALAGALAYPCVSMATKVEFEPDTRQLVVHKEASGGRTEVVQVDLPAVLTVQTGINTPRTESFKAVMMAKRAQIEVTEPEDLPPSTIQVQSMSAHAPSRGQLQLIEGDPAEVAARIRELVQEVSQ